MPHIFTLHPSHIWFKDKIEWSKHLTQVIGKILASNAVQCDDKSVEI